MRRVFLAVLTAKLCLACHMAFAIAASQAWVTNYVASAASRTTISNGVVTTERTLPDGASLSVSSHLRIVAALQATNATALAVQQGVTNGMYFVWNGDGDAPAYVNPPLSVDVTRTNMAFFGVSSVETNGFIRFEGFFDAAFLRISDIAAYAATNRTEVAE